MSDRRAAVLERPMYSVIDAARSLGLTPAKTRGWLDGYERQGVTYPPVIRPMQTTAEVVTWGEYVELWYLNEYRRAGISLQRIRPVIARLRERYQTPYPLALAKPYVDEGERELILSLQEDHDVPRSVALVIRTGQTTMMAERANRFYKKIEFGALGEPGEGEFAQRIRPAGSGSPVLIDPAKRFGRPQVDGISTEALWELHDAGESFDEIATIYEMEEWRVRAGIAYQEQLLLLVG